MAAKEQVKAPAQADQVSLPLRLRLKAWWEGYDSDELRQRYEARLRAAGLLDKAAKEPKEKTISPLREKPPPKAKPADKNLDPWDAEKLNIAQYIWGEGFCGPGGPDYIVALSKLMALSPEMSMLQIGANIGGPARVLAEKFGVWITGYEESAYLVDKGQEMSKMAGVEKKTELVHYNPDDFPGFERKFDRAFAKEALFTIEDKAGMLEKIENKLKPGGLMLITDYVLGSEAVVGKEAYKEWKVGERTTPYPILSEELTALLKKMGLQVRVSEEITKSYLEMINKAWTGADTAAAKLAKQENGPFLIQTLMREAEFWNRRKKMMENGDLKLWRIVANKKMGGPSMMSDW